MALRLLRALDRAPLYWTAVGLALLLFGVNRMLPGIHWPQTDSEQAMLDLAVVNSLRADLGRYQAAPDVSQPYGAHVLPHYLLALVSRITGDAGRAGIWLSLCGVIATLCGLYGYAFRIFPFRGFSVITLAAAGAMGALHFAISPDPSAALGMALVVWGMVFFLNSLTKLRAGDVLISGFLFGLAGYIRIELSLFWLFLALYLVGLAWTPSEAKRSGLPLAAMALGGLLMVLIVLWPMLHRNLTLSGSPILPGFDAERVLGAPLPPVPGESVSLFSRLGGALKMLMFNSRGSGLLSGLLWPVGLLLLFVVDRHHRLPYFWLPALLWWLFTVSAMSFLTGMQSLREVLLILTPLLFPFAVLPAAFGIQLWLMRDVRTAGQTRGIWLGAGVAIWFMVQVPHFLRIGDGDAPGKIADREALLDAYAKLPARERDGVLFTDMPGSFLAAGKTRVIGARGECDWRVLTAKYADGSFDAAKLLQVLKDREVTLLHLSRSDDTLVLLLQKQRDAPNFNRIRGFPPPHQVYLVSRP